MYSGFSCYSIEQPKPAEYLSRCTADSVPRPVGQLVFRSYGLTSFKRSSNKLHPFATNMAFGTCRLRTNRPSGRLGFILRTVTSFHRPKLHHYYGIICHLTSLRLALSCLLYLPIPAFSLTYGNNIRLPRLRRIPCEQSHPQTRYGTDQVSGFTLFCTFTLPQRRIRFACAMYCSLPIASFRPCRYQQRLYDSDCLPPGRGDACLSQAGFARPAEQTKKSGPNA